MRAIHRYAENMRFRLDLGYDGTDFHGWARQPGLRTVQGEIEQALKLILRTDDIALTVGGRTDAGVHARGQVAHLDIDTDRDDSVSAHKLNSVLRHSAPDIVVHSVTQVSDAFDARFSATSRRYEYRLRDRTTNVDPLSMRYTTVVPVTLDLPRMHEATEQLTGLRDFTTFCKAREGATAIRTLTTFDISQEADEAFVVELEADAFCHSMVRALVGAIVAVGSGRLSIDQLAELRDARQRTSSITVMPAHGLTLQKINYAAEHEWQKRAEQTRARRIPNSW